jgi:SOS regulatory protein LexA
MYSAYSEYKEKIIDFYRKHKRMPAYTEVMKLLGFKSKNAVYKLINKLIEEGIVTKDAQGRLSPSRLFGEIPLLGVVEAGIPTLAEEQLTDNTTLEDLILDTKEKTYLLEVKGDSMIEAHIAEGDLVLVERREFAKEGEIVIAEVDGGWTMKYFKKDKKGRAYLLPANKKYAPIYPEENLRIAAVVKAVIRKF